MSTTHSTQNQTWNLFLHFIFTTRDNYYTKAFSPFWFGAFAIGNRAHDQVDVSDYNSTSTAHFKACSFKKITWDAVTFLHSRICDFCFRVLAAVCDPCLGGHSFIKRLRQILPFWFPWQLEVAHVWLGCSPSCYSWTGRWFLTDAIGKIWACILFCWTCVRIFGLLKKGEKKDLLVICQTHCWHRDGQAMSWNCLAIRCGEFAAESPRP